MDITKSRALLLSLFVCFSLISSVATPISFGNEKKPTKELIIVNVDAQLTSQLGSLVEYVHNLYQSNKDGVITIKTYMNIESDQSSVDSLIILLRKVGVSKSDIKLIKESSTLENPYFTLSVSSRSAIQ
jgi:hypothetical protein